MNHILYITVFGDVHSVNGVASLNLEASIQVLLLSDQVSMNRRENSRQDIHRGTAKTCLKVLQLGNG